MKKLFLSVCTMVLGTIATVNVATAQGWISQGWGVGASGGVGFSVGDISLERFSDLKYHCGVSVQKELFPYFDVKGNFMLGALQGHKDTHVDKKGNASGLRFRSDYVAYNAMLKFRFTDLMVSNDAALFSIYLQAGAGMLHFKSVLYNYTPKTEARTAESGVTNDIDIPVGIGFEFRFTPAFSAVLDFTGHITSATKLDVVKNESFRDMFFTPGIGINYVFGKTKKPAQVPYQQVYSEPARPVVKETVKEVEEVDFETVAVETPKNDVVEFDFDYVEPAPAKPVTTQPATTQPATTQPVTPARVETKPEVAAVRPTTAPATTREGLVYRVQISARQTYNANMAMTLKSKYALSQVPFEEVHEGLYKYTVGSCRTLEEANVLRETMVAKGITDAFVVPYYVSKRISNQEARNLLQR